LHAFGKDIDCLGQHTSQHLAIGIDLVAPGNNVRFDAFGNSIADNVHYRRVI
jgi:hypothetical protein